MLNVSQLFRRSLSSVVERKTGLFDFHVSQGAKMVPFCGWSMPLQYKDGIIESHVHTRTHAAIFDVSHMLQLLITGKDREAFVESVTVADVSALKPRSGTYTLITNDHGGVIDDALVNRYEDHIYMVVNAGCADKDFAHLIGQQKVAVSNGLQVDIQPIPGSLIALQGPRAHEAMASQVQRPEDLNQLFFMDGGFFDIQGSRCRITRCGYTGEDGFEISIPEGVNPEGIVQALLKHSFVRMAGLGARDTLRLESGLCLYGQDLSETWSPAESSLLWTIPKSRREKADFPGAKNILNHIKNGVNVKRVGFIVENSRRIPRTHSTIVDPEGREIGEVSSGAFGPSMHKPVGMAYVHKDSAKIGTALRAKVGNDLIPITVAKLPFVPLRYRLPQ